jgi:hypothetical protein
MNIVSLPQIRISLLVCFSLSAVWFLVAVLGDVYMVRPQPLRTQPPSQTGLDYGPRKPLADYLSVTRREMFKQSVLYETKAKEVINILGDFIFLGVIREGDVLRAFVLNTKTSQSTIYSVGQTIGDVQIQEIREDRLILTHGSETLELAK